MACIYRVRLAEWQQHHKGDKTVAEQMIPITMFVGMTVIISLFFWFRYRARTEMQQTLRNAIEKGQELTPELVETLGMRQKPSKDRDIRFALMWLALAAALALFGWGMGSIEREAFVALLSIAAFPFMIGLAYLVMWRFTERAQ